MNVNILTIHKAPNYGAVLQAYALYRTVQELGFTPHIINLSIDWCRWPYNWKYRLLVPLNKWLKGYHYCHAKAEKFSREHCPNQIGDFHSLAELEAYPWSKDDIYLIGSDQVWNPEITMSLSRAFCFSFLPKDATRRYAYAASLGNIKDERKRADELDIAALKLFRHISVREKFGVDFLHRNGIESREVIDPTLLIADYSDLLPHPVVRRHEIVFLSLSDTDSMNTFVSDVARSNGLTVNKRYGYLQPGRSKNKAFLSVEEWLYSIACAEVVITDSFHATVFAILFSRQFYVYISEPSKVFRSSNLLDKLGIKGRIVNDVSEVSLSDTIDYVSVKRRLADYRKDSLDYLMSMFNENSDL